MSLSTKILMFVVGALLFTFLALFLTRPALAQSPVTIADLNNEAIDLFPYLKETEISGVNYYTIDRDEFPYNATDIFVTLPSSGSNFQTNFFYYSEDVLDGFLSSAFSGSGAGGSGGFFTTRSTFPLLGNVIAEPYIFRLDSDISVSEDVYYAFYYRDGSGSCANANASLSPVETSLLCATAVLKLVVIDGVLVPTPLYDAPPVPDLSYRDSLSWVRIDIPEYNQMYLTEEIDLGVSYRLRGQNPYNMSQPLCDLSMDYTLSVFARPANNAGATLVPIYMHGFNPSPVGEGASAVCVGTITAQNLDLSSFNFGYSSLMLNAVLSIGTPTPPLSSNLDFLVSSEDPIFINLNGINDYLDETGAETPLDTPPSSYEDCTTWDFSCQITNAFLFLFRPTISIQQRAMNLWNDLYPRTPIPYIEFVISDLVPVVRSLSSAESSDDGSVSISFPTQEMFDWDEDINVFSFSRETFTGEDSYLPVSIYNTFRLLIGLGIHLAGIMYLVTATRRFFGGLYS